ncbi:MAG: UDP-3-O-acyl-N-acetylglucosamine deacetylase [Nitrospirota bacterium]
MLNQKTIKRPVTLSGVGLHSGERARVTICPAPAGTGIVFLSGGARVRAVCDSVGDTSYATSLLEDGVRIGTVEHILAALAGLLVDNAYIETDGGEVPILDGSAWPFVKAIKEAGLSVQGMPRRYMKVVKDVTVHDGDKSASILPSPVSTITSRIDFDNPLVSDQSLSMEYNAASFERELAPARTFGFFRDAEMLRQAGLARGASLENAVVIGEDGILNHEGLRFPDEFVRHKMLDMIGDLSLTGFPIIGHFVADKPGHALNHRLVRELLARPDCWIMVEGHPAEEAEATMAEAVR